jgi:Flp pilus assembly protein TadD
LFLLFGVVLLAGCAGTKAGTEAEPGLNVGRAALESGAPQIALRISAAKLAHSPNDVAALVLQGDAYTEEGLPESASAAFSRALALAPDSTPAKLGLGRLALATDPSHAETMFLSIVAEDPRNAVALNDLGIARDLQGRHMQAQTAYEQALGVAPDARAPMVNLALSMALSGQAGQARNLLAPLASSPDATSRVRQDYALVTELSGDRGAAAALLEPELSAQEAQAALSGYDALVGKDAAPR